ncbi:beta-1,3-galactosyltransferase 1 isoform X3 [Dermacentor silvarum]|uniref:beta-1,3-galactosyltransferase 1 isoform X3 n=1 Tax=Dermacentor silvarum TaxID=543639 RepID=UPI001897D969|nr:beta-1,3-galactosyltransferase 1 isoform X3 [Dermacentor silvarum]
MAPTTLSRRPHARAKSQEDMSSLGVRLLPRLAAVAVCLLFCYGILYRNMNSGRHRPDMSWLLAQQNLRLLVPNDSQPLLAAPRHPCPRFLLVVICSAVANGAARRALRDAWMRDATSPTVRAFFLLGRTANASLQEQVRAESELFGDIIQADFLDTYNNLTIKSVMLLKWVDKHCPRSRYVLKTDDDMYVNVQNLVNLLRAKGGRRLLLGCLIRGATPVRDWTSKWYVPPFVYTHHTYPDYLSGTGYVISGDVVGPLFRAALDTPFFFMEDIFITGMVAQKLGLKPNNSNGFKFYKRKNDPCQFRRLVTAHLMTPGELRAMWTKVHDTTIKCS